MEDNNQDTPEVTEIVNETPIGDHEIKSEEKPLSIRENLQKAIKGDQNDKEITDKPEKLRQSDGKFAKKDVRQAETTVQTEKLAPPERVPAGIKAKWDMIPPDIQKEFIKREQDIHKQVTADSEERNFAKQINRVLEPYMPMIRAEGGDSVRAITELLNTAYLLRTASPQAKGQMIWDLARRFGADMSQTRQTGSNLPPEIQQIAQRQQSLEQQLMEVERQKQQQEQATIQSEIGAFAASEGHEHYEAVKQHMAALLSSGLTKGNNPREHLQDAYDQAVYARPDIRSSILAAERAKADEKRIADAKAKADAAKKAGSSLRGSPGMVANKNGQVQHGSLQDALRSAFREANGG